MATIAKPFIALVLCCQGAIAKEVCSPPTEYRPALRKITLPRINTIKVKKMQPSRQRTTKQPIVRALTCRQQ